MSLFKIVPRLSNIFLAFLIIRSVGFAQEDGKTDFLHETKGEREVRMKWWREARFGMFIHWGLYSIRAGEWKNRTDHAEWIRTTAQIPIEEYDKFVSQFNPVKFNAVEWVRMAKNAGMKYIVITSKHHDGFCLFDSKYTDFNVMNTPFKRDVLKELSRSCQEAGLRLCFYHSIMDWHEPDYLPRRDWEKDRSTAGANFDRYVFHMKNQLKELLTNYGPIGVLWFDGEWESTWNTAYGKDLYNYVRNLQPDIIINNRVGAGRSGMAGMTKEGEFAGDFGTPEQEIPATGLPGIDWETCTTMNDHWGYNKFDMNFKSSLELLRMLADIASKGGNFLLNIGPTSEGLFPPTSVRRLKDIGKWMNVNGEAIYGTSASPFERLEWGRCTQKQVEGGARLYLHVFDWPSDGKLLVPGVNNQPRRAYLLADPSKRSLIVTRREDALAVDVPAMPPDSINSVVVLELLGNADVINLPKISAEHEFFVDTLNVSLTSQRKDLFVRYTIDGSPPTQDAKLFTQPIILKGTTTIASRCFIGNRPVSGISIRTFTKVSPLPARRLANVESGIAYAYYEGDWDQLPDFTKLTIPATGIVPTFDVTPKKRAEHFGMVFNGYVDIPKNGVYDFYIDSDDGSHLFIDDSLIVDNDGLHAMVERSGSVALQPGLHPIRVLFFQKGGDVGLSVSYEGPGIEKRIVPAAALFHEK